MVTPLRRGVYGLGATAVLTLALAGPGSALPPDPGPSAYNTWATGVTARANHRGPAARAYNAGPRQAISPAGRSAFSARAAVSDGGNLQYVQIGLGALGGAALASGGALTATARGRHNRLAHP